MNTVINMLLILGTEIDPHVLWVSEKVKRLGVETFILDYFEKIPMDFKVDIHGEWKFLVNGQIVDSNIIIWDRVKLREGMSFYFRDDSAQVANLRANEWRAFYHLICKMYDGKVLNSLSSRYCMLKPFQQTLARSVGLNCPPTHITTHKQSALGFCSDYGDIIMKSLSAAKVRPKPGSDSIPYNINTMRISSGDMSRSSDNSFHACPHFFQKEIKKKFELRIVYINRTFFAFKINSQIHKYYEIDWRRGNLTLDFIPYELPDFIQEMLTSFMEKIGLFSGSIDMIVDHEEEYWFLECNQDGQWGWLDPIVDGAISDEFARAFVRELELTSYQTPH